MSKENQNKKYDGQNRCRRCDRPLKDPTANYGWWCAQIVGANYDKEAESILDGDAVKLYNTYRSTYLNDNVDSHAAQHVVGKFTWKEFVDNVKKWVQDKSIKAWNKFEDGLMRFGDAVSDIEEQKALQRTFWNIGSQIYLRKQRGFYTSAWMLEHSLQDNPSDIWRGNDSRIAYLMNHDSAYLQGLDEKIAEAENEKRDWIDNKKISVEFENGDLYFSIHRMDIYLNGYKREDGKWIINAHGGDWYDFTEITSFMGDEKYEWSKEVGVGTVANDVAVVSQLTGAIQPYYVTVDFWTTR